MRLVPVLVLGLSLLAGCGRTDRPRNVLLVSIDSLRADRLGCYGNAQPTSPTIDRLAAGGVVFERAISPTSWTLPSHVTLLTGRLPHRHGTIAWLDTIAPGERLLQESFRAAGYETTGFYSGPFLAPYFGFARGFDAYVSCEPANAGAGGALSSLIESQRFETSPLITTAFSAWLDQRPAKPFFAFVHMWDVHFDYIPPAPYDTMFDPSYRGKLDGRDIAGPGFPTTAPPRDVQHLLALYDGEIRYTDATIDWMLTALRRAGLLDDTLVVLTSDHGEEFLEHLGKTHHRTVYAESVHVPLVLWATRGLPPGLRIPDFVSLADVAPTILELVGLPALSGIDGRSLAPALRGEPLSPRPVLAGMFQPGEEARRMLAVREPGRSAIFWAKRNTWSEFNTAADPGERRVLPIPPGPGREPLEAYDREVMALLDARRTSAAPDATGARPPADIVDRLKSLGYIH